MQVHYAEMNKLSFNLKRMGIDKMVITNQQELDIASNSKPSSLASMNEQSSII